MIIFFIWEENIDDVIIDIWNETYEECCSYCRWTIIKKRIDVLLVCWWKCQEKRDFFWKCFYEMNSFSCLWEYRTKRRNCRKRKERKKIFLCFLCSIFIEINARDIFQWNILQMTNDIDELFVHVELLNYIDHLKDFFFQ